VLKNFNKATAILILFLIPTLAVAETAAALTVRKITPPNLSTANLGKKILCYRPMRRGAPNMTVEMLGDKVIANNYGHGGSGWTLGPGTAEYVDSLLINSAYAKYFRRDTPITIIGAGVIGLYTAYDLYQKGYTNITIVADKFDNLTSHNAGGLLAPVSMDNDPAMQNVIDKIGIDAYKFYAAIANKKNPNFKTGAVIVPTYFEDRDHSGLEPYIGKVMQPAKDVLLDFGNGTTRKMVEYADGIFIDTATLMRELSDYLKAQHVVFKQQKIKSFAEIKTKYIMNCAGLGAKQLTNDQEMVSVQGHLIMLKNQRPAKMQYMILVYFGEDTTQSGQKITRSFYIFPKHLPGTGINDVGVIGGTFIEGATSETPNEQEFATLLKNAREFYGLAPQT
jgi:D-amino-acid oxidase